MTVKPDNTTNSVVIRVIRADALDNDADFTTQALYFWRCIQAASRGSYEEIGQMLLGAMY